MESAGAPYESKQFKTPDEELSYLREQVARKERELTERSISYTKEHVVRDALKTHVAQPAEAMLHPEMRMPAAEVEKMVLDLDPEEHDSTMGSLINLIREKGILNAISVVSQMNDPHVADDLHRFLVAYVAAGMPAGAVDTKAPVWKAVNHTLFEISVPTPKDADKQKPLKEMLSVMEQFYAGMTGIAAGDPNDTFSLEIANPQGTAEFVFYASVPSNKGDLFEKQVLSAFPHASVRVERNDYNVFASHGASAGSTMKLAEKHILPIKSYETFDYDPINILLSAFSKLKDVGEGAAVQIVMSASKSGEYVKAYKKALDEIEKGGSVKKAMDIRTSLWGQLGKDFKELVTDLAKDASPIKSEKKEEQKVVDSIVVDHIKQKISAPILATNIRIVASGESRERAEAILSEIEACFNQFAVSTANAPKFERALGTAANKHFQDFSFRLFDEAKALPLNIKEIVGLFHFPTNADAVAPTLRKSDATTAPAPLGVSTTGILLGINDHRGQKTEIRMSPEDRLRHFYVIGQTGTGKTTILKNMIIQDIRNGDGVCMIDPHGSDIDDVLAQIPPERYEDVIYFDPASTARPIALNMLEYDRSKPEQKTFVVNELFSIFQKLYSGSPESMGPMFEQYFRNATMLVIEDPDSGCTLLDVSRVMSNKAFRDMKISRCKNPVVAQFWREVAEKAGGDASLANMVPYITSKFDVFLANDVMRPIIAQEKSSFNFREIMDSKKILLVNLAKGRLGDINSSLIGLIVVGKILMAALSRVDSLGTSTLNPFYLYIDEFQNVTTPSISTILSEARKYKLSLNVAHQFIAQLEEGIKNSVFGNVGSMATFRVGQEDAEFLEKQYAPVFTASDIAEVPNYNTYVKLLAQGKPLKPFSLKVPAPEQGDRRRVDLLKELSSLKFGRLREEVERDIMAKY
jgi:hypothetical protein